MSIIVNQQKSIHHNHNVKKIGYARVSTDDQKMDLQLLALQNAGCDVVFTDKGISGAKSGRPGLQDAINSLNEGDTLVVWRLDRLGRSLVNLVQLVSDLGGRGIEFRSLSENIDTSSSGGRLVFHIMAALAEFERSLISERTRAGMHAARLKGKHLGRPSKISASTRAEIRKAIATKEASMTEIARRFKVGLQTVRNISKEKP